MVFLKTEDEIELMRAANLLVADTLAELGKIIRPGVSTAELDKVAEEYIRDHGAVPTFKGFPNPFGGPFPGSVCTSVNDVVVHGIPGEEVLKDGAGYGVVREFVGHGIGKEMHEDPQVPNYGRKGNGILIKNGLCIAIEPMITMGSPQIYMMPDRWTIKTRDGKPAAHFEHTIAIHHGKADILSSFEKIENQQN